MREILFRLRDGATKKIIPSRDNGISMTLETGRLWKNGHDVTDRYIKEQHIFVDDEDDVKIFEGDKVADDEGNIFSIAWHKGHNSFFVKDWPVDRPIRSFDESDVVWLCVCRVIGSIHDEEAAAGC